MSKSLLIILTFISAIWIWIFIYYFEILPEPFAGAEELGPVLYELSIAYISALIFYIVIVYLKQKQDRKNINPYISRKANKIVSETTNLIKDLSDVSRIKIASSYPTEEELIKICCKINVNGPVQFHRAYFRDILDHSSWWKYINSYNQEIQNAISQILNKSQYLEGDTKLIEILTDIEDSIFIEKIRIEAVKNVKIPTDLSIIKCELQHFLILVKKLEKYAKWHLKKYNNNRK